MTAALKPEDTRDALRKIGVLLLGIGIAMLWMRKEQDWSDFVNFLILAIPAVLFYGGALYTLKDTGGLQPWQAVASVLGLLFVPFALAAFVDMVGGNPGSDLNTFWIFAVTAGLAAYAGLVAGVRFQLLAASLVAIISWTALWNKLLGDDGVSGHIGVYRGLLGILAILILAAAVMIWRSDRRDGLAKASELLTGAGVAAVIGCALGITSGFGPFVDFFGVGAIGTNALWNILLLVISIGLIGIGSRIGKRGPVYVGGIGLLLFLVIVGQDLGDSSPEPNKVGWWPPVLLVLGAAAIAASLQKGATLGNRPREIVKRISTH
jgi:hypothetical protein